MDYAIFLAAVREAGGYDEQQDAAETARVRRAHRSETVSTRTCARRATGAGRG